MFLLHALHRVGSILGTWGPAFLLDELVIEGLSQQQVAAELYLIFAALRPAFPSFTERKRLCADLYLYIIREIFGLILAALWTTFSSLANSTYAQF
jgi:hypothetical protein